MWEIKQIPGYAEALNTERIDRAIAFIGLPEKISDIDCVPLTPERLEWLHAFSSPFIVGGERDRAHILQFMWIVNPDFKPGKENQSAFVSSMSELDEEDALDEIDGYLDRAFLDAPYGKSERPYYSTAADLVTAMASDPFHWPMEKTMQTALPIIYQLLKCVTRCKGYTVINRRSDKIAGDWLDELKVLTEVDEKTLSNRVAEYAAEWEPASNPSPNQGRYHDGKLVGASWSIAMRRKAVPRG